MALGPEERAALKTQIYEQYRQQPEHALHIGLELALRGLEISRKQLDANRLEWDDYVRLKGHYNATAHGVLAVFEERGWTPGVVQLWKRFHGPLWMDLEEPDSPVWTPASNKDPSSSMPRRSASAVLICA